MEIVVGLLVVLHFLGLAGVIGGYAAVMRNPKVIPAILHGAITQVVTGVLLVGIHEMGDAELNHMKIGVKLLVALAVLVAAFVGARSDNGQQSATMAKLAAGLAVVNVVVAVFWS